MAVWQRWRLACLPCVLPHTAAVPRHAAEAIGAHACGDAGRRRLTRARETDIVEVVAREIVAAWMVRLQHHDHFGGGSSRGGGGCGGGV
jgi:hypothetical protein